MMKNITIVPFSSPTGVGVVVAVGLLGVVVVVGLLGVVDAMGVVPMAEGGGYISRSESESKGVETIL